MNIGTKIFCIRNKRTAFDSTPRLYVNKEYTLKSCYISYNFKENVEYVELEEHINYKYRKEDFLTVSEYRKKKLNKLKKYEKI